MEVLIGILAFLVATLAVLQGWQMRKKNNPGLGDKLDMIITKLMLLERRLEDIWNKLEER